MEAIILAGGLGTRLQSVVKDVPKPMAPVNDKPFLEYILNYLSKNNITRIILSVGYKYEIIEDYFGDSFNNIELVYSIENEPLGTGGAIKKALSLSKSKEVFIINGDTFFDVTLSELRLNENSKLLLSLKEMKDFDRYGCVEIDSNDYVSAFTEKEYRNVGNINGGVYLISNDIFNDFKQEKKFSFEEFMENEFKNLNTMAKVFDSYFIDIGIPKDYQRSQIDFKNKL